MSREIQNILQLPSNVIDNSAGTRGKLITPPIMKELDEVTPYQRNIYVVCDEIKGSFVNGKVMGVLGNIHVSNDLDYKDHVTTAHKRIYFRWLGTSLSKIEIKFYDEYLHLLRMRYGNSFALLHFRQCQA